MSEWLLDRPEVQRVLFYPRREQGFAPGEPNVLRLTFEVGPALHVGARLYPADRQAPAILYFHGNGEIAADYDGIAPLYTGLGITLLVVDYRGYGTSGGQPTASHLLADAVRVLESVGDTLEQRNLAPARLYVMGRSLGSAAAIEAARHAGGRLAGGRPGGGRLDGGRTAGDWLSGLIVESGFADTFALLARLGLGVQGADEEHDGFRNAAKMAEIRIPTLVIHGRSDVLIPAADGQELYRRSAAADKQLVLIPGAGHNDLLWVGRQTYMEAIRAFVGVPL